MAGEAAKIPVWDDAHLNEFLKNPGKYVPSRTNVESLSYSKSWEVTGTPRYYILDKERRIVARPESLRQVIDLLKGYKR